MKKYISLFLCALMVFALFGCAENAGVGVSDGFYSFIDDSGRSINLKNQPEKVAVLSRPMPKCGSWRAER